MAKRKLKYNMRVNPYRGVYTEIAKREGVTHSAIIQSVQNGNTRIIEMVEEECKRREEILFRTTVEWTEDNSDEEDTL